MAIQTQPSRISEPFAGSGTKNVIPATNTTPSASQAASWASGFPPECSQPISAGGCPVPRDDMNGVLNWLSQGFAFRQDGGVWEWSALADYDTQRMVRGSDGLLYWSVAQSGPGVAAGAQNPTTDTGVYWSTVPMLTPPLGDKSNKTATTEWVKNLVSSSVYVDASAGDDSNDGLTAGTAVKSISKGLDIISKLPSASNAPIVLNIEAGTYTDDVDIENALLTIQLSGNVTINGFVGVHRAASVTIEAPSGDSLTINTSGEEECFAVYDESNAFINCNLVLQATSTDDVIVVSYNSVCFINGDLNIAGNSVSVAAVYVQTNCYLRVNGAVDIQGSNILKGVRAFNSVFVNLNGGLTESSGITAQAFDIGNSSRVSVAGNCVAYGSVNCVSCSSLSFDSYDTLSFNRIGNSDLFNANFYSTIDINGGNNGSQVTLNLGSQTAGRCFYVAVGSFFNFSPKTAAFSGSCGTVAFVLSRGILSIDGSASISGTVNGKRYDCLYYGYIYTGGAGANRIPGSTAGTVNSTTYGYYA